MALIKCPECGKEISNMAEECPYCGISMEEIQARLQRIEADEVSIEEDNNIALLQQEKDILQKTDNNKNNTRKNSMKWIIVGGVALLILLIAVGVVLPRFLLNTQKTKVSTLEQIKQECEKYKSELPDSYVVLGECVDSVVQKIYFANNVWYYYKNKNNDDFEDTTFLIVYDFQTKKTDTLMKFGTSMYDWTGFIDFFYLENRKLFFSETTYRLGSHLSYIDVYTDNITELVDYGIINDENGVSEIHVKDGRLYYTKKSCINEEDTEFECDKKYAYKEYSIHI